MEDKHFLFSLGKFRLMVYVQCYTHPYRHTKPIALLTHKKDKVSKQEKKPVTKSFIHSSHFIIRVINFDHLIFPSCLCMYMYMLYITINQFSMCIILRFRVFHSTSSYLLLLLLLHSNSPPLHSNLFCSLLVQESACLYAAISSVAKEPTN